MDYRKVYLRNGEGAQISLNGEDGIYASNLTGLGMERSRTYGDLGGGFFSILADTSDPQQAPGFKLTFTRRSTAYAQYQRLTRWIAAAGDELRLVYVPYGTTAYYRRVALRHIKKTERNKVGWLECACEVQTLTPWYRPIEYSAALAELGTDVMRYGVGRYDAGRYAASHAATYAVSLQPDGDTAAALSLHFTGAIARPVIELIGQGSHTVYGRCSIAWDLPQGATLEWSSHPADSYCRAVVNGEPQELYDYMDPDETPFFRLPLAEPCWLRLTGQAIEGAGTVKANYFYRTV